MPQKTPFGCPELSWLNKFTSESWRLQLIKLRHPEQLQVEHQKNLTIHCTPRHVEPSHWREFKANQDSVKDLDAFRYLEHVENITDMLTQPPAPPLLRTEIYPGAGNPLSDYIAEPWERDTQGCIEAIIQKNPHDLFAMYEQSKYIRCGIKPKGKKQYYVNMRKL